MPVSKVRRKKSSKSRLSRQAEVFHAWMRESDGADDQGRFQWNANLPWSVCKKLMATERRWIIEVSVWPAGATIDHPFTEVITTEKCLLSDLEGIYHETKTLLSLEMTDQGFEIEDRGWDMWVLTSAREKKQLVKEQNHE